MSDFQPPKEYRDYSDPSRFWRDLSRNETELRLEHPQWFN